MSSLATLRAAPEEAPRAGDPWEPVANHTELTMTTPSSSLAPSTAASSPPPETFCTSGPSPTVHVVGAGAVGRALLRLLEDRGARVVAVSDSTATVYDAAGLDLGALIAHKERGRPLATRTGAAAIPTLVAVDVIESDVVIDVTSSPGDAAEAAVERSLRVLRRGAHLVLAAKDALCHAPRRLLAAGKGRLHCHAVLGGTGARLLAERAALQRSVAIVAVANASTTAVVLGLERGLSLDDALATARAKGLLERDATLDLDGTDAARKLAIASGLLWSNAPRVAAIAREHIDQLDVEQVRWAARRGRTTRLVARATRNGSATVRYESLDRRSPLAVPADRVVYGYERPDGRQRWHVGVGLGPVGTAAALVDDLDAVVAAGGRP